MPSHSTSHVISTPYSAQQSSSSLPATVQRPAHQLVPEQQHQLANIHRFTPSCSRCRQKKLKCDTNLPCNQCIAKGVHNDCRKDSRIPRGRKRPKISATSSSGPDEEIAALRRRVKELEDMMARQNRRSSSPRPASSSSSQRLSDKRSIPSHMLGTSSRGSQTSAPSDLDYSHSRNNASPTAASFDSDDDQLPGETETSLTTLEKLAASDPRVTEPGHGKAMAKQINNVSNSQIPPDAPNAYFAPPTALNERIEILTLAKRIIPSKFIADTLIHTFNVRCHSWVGRIVHMPSFQRDIDFFTHASVEECLLSPKGMYDLARYLMVLRLGLRFYPWKGSPFTSDSSPEFIAINALKNRGDNVSGQWLTLAKRALAADRTFSLGSLTAIQTALLMILDGRDSPSYLRMLLRIAIQTALDMGLHRLGRAMPSPANPDEDIVRLETGVRIWWYLVVKDWCSAQREGAYTIHPTQMTTRKPLHTTDAMLAAGRTDEISLGEHCEMSYTLCQIGLANIIRESIDLRNEQSMLGGTYDSISPTNRKLLQVKLETFLADLPPFYELESNAMHPPIVAVQRSLLHQQAFNVLLKLNRKSLASYSERATCTLLAEQIVSTQTLLRSVCPVIDGFWVNFLHLFGATLTLIISLLLDSEMDAEARERRRRKVHTALTTMRETPGSDRGSRIIETLLAEEQRLWQSHHGLPLDLASLTRRIVEQTLDPATSAAERGGGAISVPIEAHCGTSVWDVTPDESLIPAFASGWGSAPLDVLDPTQLMPWQPADELYSRPSRPYIDSLRPWQEPSSPRTESGGHNPLWDWLFSHAALLHGPDPPVEGNPNPPQSQSQLPPQSQAQLPPQSQS